MSAHSLGVEIACNGPTGRDDCPDSAAIPARFTSRTARQVRADGRSAGWQVRPGGRDLCPNCAPKETR
ncbi:MULTISPECIES: hypothetical protein [Streptomyces]|uniref:Uncharacterized protein n=1 Tax=Streptomyces flavovirens TaxID=52258 RepID=A0ABV8ND19_9ACTN|nr:hypothetical protein [Streptomyces sp. MBT51]MBK3596282.1 hypothetical protein [Streptomyces sp. MBT51]